MAAKAGAAADHAEHQAAPAAKAEAKPMDHGAGCCAGMNHGAAAKADGKAAAGCCANMAMDHTAAKADGKAAAGCCAGMSHGATAKADDKAAGGCCANMKAGDAADPHAGHTADAK